MDSNGNQANGSSSGSFPPTLFPPSISANGRYVAFESWATNLVPNDTNGTADVFVHDRHLVPDTVEDTLAAVDELLASGGITNAGIATSLTATLNTALQSQENGNVYAARNTLLAFINQVQAQSGKRISEESAAFLIEAANNILATLQ